MLKRKILCPVCGRRIMDSMENIHIESVSEELIGDINKWKPQIALKCWGCKKTIALKVC